jgi:hypothetical protein
MFSPQIVESEEFLSMPVSSQALYFHLGMNADDDGFIQPKIIMRTVGAAEDDLKVLLAKRFLLAFETGVVVIKHWLIHNLIQKDRYHPTRFQEEKSGLLLKDNKAYTENTDSVNKMLPEVRLGKGKLPGEVEDDVRVVAVFEGEEKESRAPAKYPNKKVVSGYFPFRDKSWLTNKTELEAMELLYERGEEAVRGILKFVAQNCADPYFPQVTKPSDLERKWRDIQAYAKRNGL